MLVLSRRADEVIRIGDDIRITVRRIQGSKVKIGIDCPRHLAVCRGELDSLNGDTNESVCAESATVPRTEGESPVC